MAWHLVKLSNKCDYFSSVLKETCYQQCLALSPSHLADLVLLCADNVPVFLNKVLIARLSPMMREIFQDQMTYDGSSTCHLPDYNSDIVRKMVEIIYTGKAMIKTLKWGKRIKKLMKSFGISILLDCGDGNGNSVLGKDDIDAQDADINTTESNESLSKKMLHMVPDKALPLAMKMKTVHGMGKADENRESEEGNDVEMEWFASVKGFNLATSLQAKVSMPISRLNGSEENSQQSLLAPEEAMDMMSDKNGDTMANECSDSCSDDSDVVIEPIAVADLGRIRKSLSKSFKKKRRGNTSKAASGPIEEKSEGSNSKTFQCSDCNESFKHRSKLSKHQVDSHYYEDLENLLVAEFLESNVCCKLDFSKTGFGMFIRHKAEKHGAIQLLLRNGKVGRNDNSDEDFDN